MFCSLPRPFSLAFGFIVVSVNSSCREQLFPPVYGFCDVSLYFIGTAKYGINFGLQAAACLHAAIERVT